MSTSESKLSFTLKRFLKFLGAFRRSKRGMLGVGILVFFAFFALVAPLLTTYDPVYDEYISGDYAVPIWFKYVHVGHHYSENFDLLANPGFPTPESLEDEWKFTAASADAQVSLRYSKVRGHFDPGCAAVTLSCDAGSDSTQVKVSLEKEFHYPFNSPPKRFACEVALFAENIEDLEAVDVRLFIIRIENESYSERYPLWVEKLYETSSQWKSLVLSSYASKAWVEQYFGGVGNPANIVFSKPVNYTYDIEILFDYESLAKDIEGTVYIDDVNIEFLGSTFGLLGTDQRGRDIFTQLVHGARISLFVGLLSAVLSVGIGLMLGLVSGYLGRVVDEVVMRLTDMLLVLPSLPLLLVLIAVLSTYGTPLTWNIIILIGFLGWMGFARSVRSQVLSLRERPFVEAARAVGAGKFHIILRHILPNVMSLVYVSLAMSVPSAILAEAALSWLGLYDPSVMSWGRMLHDAQFEQGVEKWWWIVPPGLCIAAISISFILLGYALDEILNPKLRTRR